MLDIARLAPYRYSPMQGEDIARHFAANDRAIARKYTLQAPVQERALATCVAILHAASELARTEHPEHLTIESLVRKTGISRPTVYRYFEGIHPIRNCVYEIIMAHQYEKRVGFLSAYAEGGFQAGLEAYAFLGMEITASAMGDYARHLDVYRDRNDVFVVGHRRAGALLQGAALREGRAVGVVDPVLFTLPSMSLALHYRQLWLEDPGIQHNPWVWDRAVEYYLDMQFGLIAAAERRVREGESQAVAAA